MRRLAFVIPLLLIPIAYVATLARSVVLGDPAEYTFVAHILGIAHPPGYAFLTLLGKAFQTLIPFGEISWRMHLLSAAAGTAATLFTYATLRTIFQSPISNLQSPSLSVSQSLISNLHSPISLLSALFAAFTIAFAANFWQHSIHANPHILTATFLAANLFLLTRWGMRVAEQDGRADRWLYAFCLSAGLGVTHHPLTVMAFPAYLLFVLWVRPTIWREGRTLLAMIGFALLGLSIWLYFPIRSPMEPPFGPSTMNTLNGFLDHVLARGLSESLPFFALADLPNRALVFWTLLRLQYSLPVIFLALLGMSWLLFGHRLTQRRKGRQERKNFAPFATLRELPLSYKLALLYGLSFLGNYAFVMSLRAQDVMAYLLGIFLIVGLLAGIGLYGVLTLTAARLRFEPRWLWLLTAALFLLGPGLQLARNAPRISLRDYDEGEGYITAVFERFNGRNEGAVLLNDWEHMTPLWYAQFVEERWPDAADVRPLLVSTARPWVESVFDYLSGGPVYLSNYRREIVDAGFRLRPDGPFYQVVEPEETSIPERLESGDWETERVERGEVEIVGYLLPQREVTAGDYVPLTLAMRAPQGTADFYVPVVRVGEMTFAFTTDSHLTSPNWRPNEVIVERFDFALPHDLAAGAYPLTVTLKNLNRDEEAGEPLSLGELQVTAQPYPIDTAELLGNFRQRVGLAGATARAAGQRVRAPWESPLTVQPGDTIHLTLQWASLARAEESYTVFVHLIDLGNRPLVTLDYTPLGGSTPTHLWIPKWLPGQKLLDPYRLTIPADTPPGTYLIEVGLYEMVSGRRLHLSDAAGNLVGDRLILGAVVVER